MPGKYDNRGAIWPNRNRNSDTSPDFTGSVTVEGVEYWVNAWKKRPGDAANRPSLSFSLRRKDEQPRPNTRSAPIAEDPDDDIPF